jgi:hypothetical protein
MGNLLAEFGKLRLRMLVADDRKKQGRGHISVGIDPPFAIVCAYEFNPVDAHKS